MRIEIHVACQLRSSQECRFRTILLNDSYEPISICRDAFVGPNVGAHHPEAVEPNFGYPGEPLVLQPFSFYGRERVYDGLPAGELDVTAYYRGRDGRKEIVETKRITILPD